MTLSSDSPAPRFAFVEGALDRADALRDNDEALLTYWHNARVILVDAEGKTRVDADGRLQSVRGGDLADDHRHALFLGMREDEAWFAQTDSASDPSADATPAPPTFETLPPNAGRIDLRSAAA